MTSSIQEIYTSKTPWSRKDSLEYLDLDAVAAYK